MLLRGERLRVTKGQEAYGYEGVRSLELLRGKRLRATKG